MYVFQNLAKGSKKVAGCIFLEPSSKWRGGKGNWIGDSSSADSEKMLSVGRKKRKSIFTAFITNCDSNLLQKGVSFLRDRGLICIGCLCENGKNVGSWEMDVLRV